MGHIEQARLTAHGVFSEPRILTMWIQGRSVFQVNPAAWNPPNTTQTSSSQEYTDPFRLYNVDVFKYLSYLSNSPTSLYGSIPLMYAHSTMSTAAVFNAIAPSRWLSRLSNDRHSRTCVFHQNSFSCRQQTLAILEYLLIA